MLTGIEQPGGQQRAKNQSPFSSENQKKEQQ